MYYNKGVVFIRTCILYLRTLLYTVLALICYIKYVGVCGGESHVTCNMLCMYVCTHDMYVTSCTILHNGSW